MSNVKEQYQRLLVKIEDLVQRQEETYQEDIRCQLGCDSCCRPPDTVFIPEAEIMKEAIRGLSFEQKDRIHKRFTAYSNQEDEMCPLLENGGCSIYEARPVICRTHGYAGWLRGEEGEDGEISWCPLNFTEQKPTKDLAFDIERLNVMLSLIARLGWPEHPGRCSLEEVITEGLGESLH